MWRFSLTGTGTRVHTEHTAVDGAREYWHVLDVTLSETGVAASVGLADNLGLELVAPFRTATTRVDYEDETAGRSLRGSRTCTTATRRWPAPATHG